MIAVDTSVAVAAALPWHECHHAARAALPRTPTQALGHVALETYSVLTRLPPPHRVPADVALAYLHASFRPPPVVLAADSYQALLETAATTGIVGGALYDALVAQTAFEAGVTLLTLDRRAARTYELIGVAYRLIDPV